MELNEFNLQAREFSAILNEIRNQAFKKKRSDQIIWSIVVVTAAIVLVAMYGGDSTVLLFIILGTVELGIILIAPLGIIKITKKKTIHALQKRIRVNQKCIKTMNGLNKEKLNSKEYNTVTIYKESLLIQVEKNEAMLQAIEAGEFKI